MAPPIFADLGKATRDIFEKGHILEMFKVTAKNRTCGEMQMKSELQYKFEDGKLTGFVEGNYPFPCSGITVTPKWTTDNKLGLATELAETIYPGVTLKSEGTFAPDSGEKFGALKLGYKNENVNLEFNYSGGQGEDQNQIVNGGIVLAYRGWLAGIKEDYDNTEGSFKNSFAAFGHSYGNFQAFLVTQNWNLFTALIYQRVSNRLEMGLSFGSDQGEEQKKFYSLGCRYLMNEDTAIRAKVDNESMVGLTLESTLAGCVKLMVSCLMDGKKLTEGGEHKFGLGVEIL